MKNNNLSWKKSWEDYTGSVKEFKVVGLLSFYSLTFLLVINIIIYWLVYLWLKAKEPMLNNQFLLSQKLTPELATQAQALNIFAIQLLIILVVWIISAFVLWAYVKTKQWTILQDKKRDKLGKAVVFTLLFGIVWIIPFTILVLLVIGMGGGLAMLNLPTWFVSMITYIPLTFLIGVFMHLGFAAYYYHSLDAKIFKSIGRAFTSFKHIKKLWKPYIIILLTFTALNLVFWLITFFIPAKPLVSTTTSPGEIIQMMLAFIMLIISFAWAKVYMYPYFKEM